MAYEYGPPIEIIAGPWPERIGIYGHVVRDPGDHIYPFDKRGPNEVVVWLPNDPLAPANSRRGWTCALLKRDIRYVSALPADPEEDA